MGKSSAKANGGEIVEASRYLHSSSGTSRTWEGSNVPFLARVATHSPTWSAGRGSTP